MNNSKHPYLNFGIYTVAVQAVMWVLFCLYDYGIDEAHWEAIAKLPISEYLLVLIIPIPIVSYILLSRRRVFSGDHPVKETLFQIVCWSAVSALISIPIFNSVNNRTWIIAQDSYSGGGIINLNGIEYLLIPILDEICAGLLLIWLVIRAVIAASRRSAAAQ